MRVWLMQTGEPYPHIPGAAPMRTAMLADELVSRAHEVVWWGSNFEHRRKRPLEAGSFAVGPGYTVRLQAVAPYARNVSWRRYWGYRALAADFSREAPGLERPDLIVTSLPSHDLARAAVEFGNRVGVPVLVDIRDLWPDYFVDVAPRGLRGLVRFALSRDFETARYALANATGIVGISQSYLDWGLRYAGRERIAADRIFYLGSRSSGAGPRQERPAGRPLVFGFLGSFGHSYDLRTVVSAARVLWEAGEKDVRFILAGTGEFANALTRQARGLPNVEMPGWLDAAGVERLLRSIDVGLAPYAEGAPQSLPNKPFQYLSASVPVVSSLGGEFREILAESGAGISYEAGSVGALVEAVRLLLASPERVRDMGIRAGELFRERFDSKAIYAAYVDHIESMVDGRVADGGGARGVA